MIRKTSVNTVCSSGKQYDIDMLRIAIQTQLPKHDNMSIWSSRITRQSIVYRNSWKLPQKRLDGSQYIEFVLRLRFDRLPVFALSFASNTRYDAIKSDIRDLVMDCVSKIEL